jgi:hypothetical protein
MQCFRTDAIGADEWIRFIGQVRNFAGRAGEPETDARLRTVLENLGA